MATRGLEVVVKFPQGVPSEDQGPALLMLEAFLRARTMEDVRVVKDLMGDDSKLRRMMTIQQRSEL